MTVLSILRDILMALSGISVAFIAWYGLKSWKKELKGKTQFKLIRDILKILSQIEREFYSARYPLISFSEANNQSKEEDTGRVIQLRAITRLQKEWSLRKTCTSNINNKLLELQELTGEAEILISEEHSILISDTITELWKCYADLTTALDAYFETRVDEIKSDDTYQDQQWLNELRQIIYQRDGDDLSLKIDEAKHRLDVLKKLVA